MNKGSLSRRGFGGLIAAAPAALAQAPDPNTSQQLQQRRPGRPADTPPFGETIEFSGAAVKPEVAPFPMTQVRVLGGPLKDAEEWNRGYMQRLSADRLLYNFRQNAGLGLAGAKPLGGWETPGNGKRDTELRGHFTGHFLSASALLWAHTQDREAKAKADLMVAELAKVQQKLGGVYLSAFPTELFERLDRISLDPETGRPKPGGPPMPWAPFYTIHKILAGMVDMYRLAGNRQALEVAQRMAEWSDHYTGSKSEAHMQEILTVEYGGMGESLYDLAALTNDDRWARVGDRFTKKRFVNPLGLRRDDLRFLHVNTHIPQVIAAARRYEISGDPRFRDVAEFFFYEVSTARSYVTTGTSNDEGWQSEPRRLAHELRHTHGTATAECCCSYNMLKLARHLYGWSPDPRLFDYYERALLNHRYGTILPGKGYTQYYLSLVPGAWKTFNDEDQSFWCCTGTGVEEYSKSNDSIYWHDQEGLYVNLFVDSELNWQEKGLRVRQKTRFPDEPGTALQFTAERPVRLALRLRVPGWLKSAPSVKLNGRELESSASPGSYLTITREWRSGDRVEMALPMHLSVESLPDDSSMQAFLYGPLVLAGDLGRAGLDEAHMVGPSAPWFLRPGEKAPAVLPANEPPPLAPVEVPRFKGRGKDPASWIQPGSQAMSFRTSGQRTDVEMRPLNRIFGTRYSVYWEVS